MGVIPLAVNQHVNPFFIMGAVPFHKIIIAYDISKNKYYFPNEYKKFLITKTDDRPSLYMY